MMPSTSQMHSSRERLRQAAGAPPPVDLDPSDIITSVPKDIQMDLELETDPSELGCGCPITAAMAARGIRIGARTNDPNIIKAGQDYALRKLDTLDGKTNEEAEADSPMQQIRKEYLTKNMQDV